MVIASHLRAGMAIRYEGQKYKVIAADYHPGQGKMGGVMHARLKNLSTGTLREQGFRSELKLEDLPQGKQFMDFLYSDAEQSYFMNPDTYEQTGIPNSLLGPQARLLQPELKLSVEFVEGKAVSVIFPEIIEVRVAETAPPAHQQQDSTLKSARLENDVEILVPQFIKVGDMIRLDVQNLRYVERAS